MFNRGSSSVPLNDVTIVNYYGTQRFSAGQVDVDGRIMEFINAETRVPAVEDQVWDKPDERLDTSYQSVVQGQTLA